MKKILFGLLGLLWAIPSFANCNLLPVYNTSPVTEHGVTFTPQPDGSIIINGSVNDDSGYANYIVARSTNNLVLPAGTYTISGITGGSSSTYILDLYGGYTSGNGNSDFFDTRAGDPITRTATSEWRIGMYAIRIMRGYTANNLVVRPMIEQGSTATPYTPYDAECIERCKNLLDPNLLQQAGIQDDTGTNSGTMTHRVAMLDYIPVTPGQKYVFSFGNSGIFVHGSYFYDENKSFLLMSTNQFNATVPENARYMRFSLQKPNNSELSVQDVINANPQLELGSTATEYVPYHPGCHETNIKVATTKYTETVFNPLNTALQSAISVVDSVVSNTITQAASIATLQSGKQTRPDETCPAYKQCLLVEDEQGVPHWYQITDPFRDFVAPIVGANISPIEEIAFYDAGYQQLEYIESTGTQWIDTGVYLSSNHAVEFVAKGVGDFFGTRSPTSYTSFGVTGRNTLDMYASTSEINAGGRLVVENMDTNTNYIYHIESGNKWVKNADNGTVLGRSTYVPNAFTIPEYTAPIFGIAWSAPASERTPSQGKLYSFKIWENGTLVRNFVPVIDNATGKVGMYDTVNGVFYTNQGTDSFVAGPVVENDANVPAPQWTRNWNANSQYNLSAGKVYGTAQCNNISGTQEHGQTATSSQTASSEWLENGAKCWCKVVGIEANNEYIKSPSTVPWVFDAVRPSVADCNKMCAAACSNRTLGEPAFRKALFGM